MWKTWPPGMQHLLTSIQLLSHTLPTDHTHFMLESLKNKFMVAGTDPSPQQVTQVPEHGHEGEFPIVFRCGGQDNVSE